jgi:Ferritin-like
LLSPRDRPDGQGRAAEWFTTMRGNVLFTRHRAMTSLSNNPPSREQLLYWLHEAAEIEHNLMCCYLYAAFSLKRVDPHWSDAQRQAVQRWRDAIVSVVFEEMSHLALVANLMNALGATPHLGRPMFPIDSGPYPAGFVIRLAPFCAATIEHFKYLERPAH